nr:gag pol polyprotein [Hymenolepis microstoma]
MSKDTESAIPLQTPAFDPENSESWFMQFEMVIRLRGITKRTTWFQHLVPILPTAIVAQFAELTPMPPDNDSYDRLKQAIISRLSVPREKRLDQLFAQVELGDRTPSQLLHYMRSLAIGSPLNDEILKKLWMKCLPKFLIPSLVTSPSRDNLDNLAKEADLIYDLQDGPGINAVKAPTAADSIMQRLNELAEQLQELKASRFSTSPHINRRRPTSPRRWRNPARHTDTVCYYHRMYGYKAKKCQPGCNYSSTDSAFSNLNPTGPERNIIPRSAVKSYLQLTNLTLRPNNNHLSNICTSSSSVHTIKRQNSDMVESTEPNCQQSAAIVSPVKEVDTELLQTDAQEFYEEIPAHSDDFNSIPGDIHNFLTKHPTISTKKRNKRKRKKIAKPIAADHQNISKLFIQNRSPKYKLLLWRLASRRSRLIHAYPSPDSKNHIFTKKYGAQPPVLHKLYRSTCEHFQKLPRSLPYCKPSSIKSNRQVNQRQHSRGNTKSRKFLQLVLSQSSAWSRRRKKRLWMHENLNLEIKQPNRHELMPASF